ncbi:MAG: tetratricopeptide repeat protein [Hyphomicrobiales bacterium]|nr:tetratricopeptide repeat protein [Hyphomicrobiales bacterium]
MTRSSVALLLAAACAGLFALSAAAEEDLPVPAPRPGDVLRIPGLPPIQMPPGARVYGPHGRQGPGVLDEDGTPVPRPEASEKPALAPPRAPEQKPQRIPPHSTPTEQAQRANVLDKLFSQLKASDSADSAKGVADAIQRVWSRSGSDTADLMMSRAMTALAAKDLTTAESLLDSIVRIEPDWAEAWNKRATVRFLRDDYDGAMADIDETLRREPRHFGALSGLGAILQKSDLDKRALEAYRRALDVYPEQPDVKKIVDKLKLEVEGRDI